MKKDDINVEAIVNYYLNRYLLIFIKFPTEYINNNNKNKKLNLNTLYYRDKANYNKFLNVNPFLLVREFQAHDDSIINIYQIKDPFCFTTCSKDKRFKIWTVQGDCIGEVNVGASVLNAEVKPVCEWKFKIDWEKLKLEEMTEVMRIYFNVSGNSPSLKDEHYTGENLLTDDDIDEKVKKKDKQQELQIVKKKRYKPLEETKKDKIFISYNDDADVKFDVNCLFNY